MAVRWDDYLRGLDTTTEHLRKLDFLGEDDRIGSCRDYPPMIRLIVLVGERDERRPGRVFLHEEEKHPALSVLGPVWVGRTPREALGRIESVNAVLRAWVRREEHDRRAHRILHAEDGN